jgi:hypothetical protein
LKFRSELPQSTKVTVSVAFFFGRNRRFKARDNVNAGLYFTFPSSSAFSETL